MTTATDGKMVTVTGRVVSAKMNQTIVVEVVRRVKHKLYKKYVRRTAKVHAHDAQNAAAVGDRVTVRSVKPVSKTKTWALLSVDERATV